MLFSKNAFLVFAFLIFGVAVCSVIGKSPPEKKPSFSSSSSEQHVHRVETSPPKKPDWMNPYATRPSANPHELKYNAVDQILDSMNLPNSLAQLIFNTTEAMGYQDILMSGKHFRPRVDGDDEYACINRCGDEISNSSIAKPTNISGFCSEIDVAEECIDKCTQPNGLWARYIHKNLKSAKDVVCMGEGKIQAFMEENQKEQFSVLKMWLGTMSSELKYNAIDSSFGLLREMCEKKIDERLWELGKSTVVVVLTLFSDGRLLDECPLLYSN